MIEIQLHSDCQSTDTVVPNKFIDTYMPEANGEFVKVYLYLLQCVQSHSYICTVSAIADHFNHTEKDVVRALNYWQKQGLLALELNSEGNISICMTDLGRAASTPAEPRSDTGSPRLTVSAVAPAKEPVSEPAPPPALKKAPSKHSYSADALLEFQKNPEISELFYVVETYIRHPLSENDMNTVLFWHEDLHFSTELIVYLLEYCITKGHTSMRYLDKVAQGWHADNITTVEQAKEDAAIHSQAYYGVMKALGITGRSLIKSETACIKKWTNEYGFNLPLIQEACRRTITATHQPSFEYTDSILTRWHENQVHTLADVQALDTVRSKARRTTPEPAEAPARKNAFNNFTQRTYDYDKLEELLLTTPMRG